MQSTHSGHLRPCHQRITLGSRQPLVICTAAKGYKLSQAGKEVVVTQDTYVIGSSSDADLQLPASRNVAARHATLTIKRQGVFCTALVGEETWDRSYTWLDGQELRPRVSYLLGTGNEMAFGEADQKVTITFEQGSGSNPLMEMLVQGMAGKASQEVQQQLKKNL